MQDELLRSHTPLVPPAGLATQEKEHILDLEMQGIREGFAITVLGGGGTSESQESWRELTQSSTSESVIRTVHYLVF